MQREGLAGRLVCTGVGCLRLTGAFSFLLMLLLSPTALTAAASGDALSLTVYEQVLITGVCMLAVVLLLLALGRRFGGQRMDAAVALIALVLIVVALVLIWWVHAPTTPPVVAALLSTVCAMQLYLGARDCSYTSIAAMTLWVSISLALAVIVGALAVLCFATSDMSTFFLAAVMLLCALRPLRFGGKTPVAPSNSQDEQGRLGDLLANDWQPLLGGCICALGFGFIWNWPFGNFQFPEALLPFGGRLIACLVLVVIFLVAGKRLASQWFSYLLLLAAAIGIAVWLVGRGDYSSSVLFLFSKVSQVLFFGVLWLQTLFTGRETRDPASLPCMGLALFLGTFLIGALSSLVMDIGVVTVLVPLLLLCYICAIAVSSLHKAHLPQREALRSATYDDLFDGVCQRLIARFELSRREGEILPFLVLGLSTAAVGERLFISPQTVKTHMHRIYMKMGIHSHDELTEVFSQESKVEV